MSKLQDQFDMGRIPIRPLPYENKQLAFTHELMVDTTGENPTNHIFITSIDDPSRVIDLSSAIILEAFNSKDLTIKIAGVKDPISIHDLIEYIYLRFVHIDDTTGFDPVRDMSKILNPDNKNVILKDINGEAIFPVVRASTIYDNDGVPLDTKLKGISHLSVLRDKVVANMDNQSVFEITYPFVNYLSAGNYMELRVGGTYISPDNYSLTENLNEAGEAFGCSISFYHDRFELDRKIEILYFYNSAFVENNATAIDGNKIANGSIPTTKLKTSNSYINNDPSTLATSRAVYRLYESIADTLSANGEKAVYAKDLANDDPDTISINLINEDITLGSNYVLVTVYAEHPKAENVNIIVHHTLGNKVDDVKEFQCTIPNGLSEGRLLRLLINQEQCIVLNAPEVHLERSRYFHYSTQSENEISFANLEYDSTSLISVYRNGIRLFEDVDFTINYQRQIITLFTKTVAKDVIVFEAENLVF